MKSPSLRRFRILFAGAVFIIFFVIFSDFRYLIPTTYFNIALSLQFIPSILKYVETGTIVSAAFAAILILTLITGRSYCSFLCPLGIGMDIFSRIGGRLRRKFRRFGFKRPFTYTRYFFLAVTLALTIIWGVYMLTLLDPFSIFGRFMTFFAKPAVLVINNFLAGIFAKFDNYTLNHVDIKGFQALSYIVPAFFFILVGSLSFTRGRLYCNMICPVGTLLGLVSKVSVLRIKIDKVACSKCGRCSLACKSSCIDFLNQKVDLSRCVTCFNCVNTCPDKAISFGFPELRSSKAGPDPERRRFIGTTLLMLFGLPSILKSQQKTVVPVPKKESTVKENRTSPVCPPGAGSISNFSSRCTACSLCISACPDGVLQAAWMQYGLTGLMQPVMDYHKGFCTYNCTRCTEICPTYALQPLVMEAKKLTQIGKAVFIKDNCIVKTEKTACGACSEACPTKAVFMIPYEGSLLIPDTNTDICIGCGHCEYACPTTPFKAIFVDGNPVHQLALKPPTEKAETPVPKEFPF